MHHDAHGWWIREAGRGGDPAPALSGDVRADVAVVGGGYLGLWTAWHLRRRDPSLRIVVLEADRCGFGPSGRNGGFATSYWAKAGVLAELFGDERAVAVARASAEAVGALGTWADAHGHDIWFRPGPEIEIATNPAQEGSWADAVAAAARLGGADRHAALSATNVARVARSPAFGAGSALYDCATVHPARLAFALRDEVRRAGIVVHEHTRVTGIRQEQGAVALTARGGVVRCRSAVLAVNHAAGRIPRYASRVATASSHVVVSAPVPDALEASGWRGGEPLCDARTMLHYFRTTRDDRIVMGWGGGRMGYGGRDRPRLSVDAQATGRAAAALTRFFPQVTSERIEAAWGGPIDVSPSRLPQYLSDGRVFAGFGFTGNGVAPSWLGGRILSGMALDVRDEATALALVDYDVKRFPPEPLRFAGGGLIRAAMVRADDDADRGVRPPLAVRALAGLPRRLGMHLPR